MKTLLFRIPFLIILLRCLFFCRWQHFTTQMAQNSNLGTPFIYIYSSRRRVFFESRRKTLKRDTKKYIIVKKRKEKKKCKGDCHGDFFSFEF